MSALYNQFPSQPINPALLGTGNFTYQSQIAAPIYMPVTSTITNYGSNSLVNFNQQPLFPLPPMQTIQNPLFATAGYNLQQPQLPLQPSQPQLIQAPVAPMQPLPPSLSGEETPPADTSDGGDGKKSDKIQPHSKVMLDGIKEKKTPGQIAVSVHKNKANIIKKLFK